MPKLPEWDREKYPFAAMLTSTDSDIDKLGRVTLAYLAFSTMPLKYKLAFFGGGLIAATDGSAIKYLIGTVGGITDEDWKRDADSDGDYAVGELVQSDTLTVVRWSNHDILNEDGSRHLAASEPVPIYE